MLGPLASEKVAATFGQRTTITVAAVTHSRFACSRLKPYPREEQASFRIARSPDMRGIALAVAAAFWATAASAEARVNIDNMSCSRVQAAVKANGAVFLSYRSKRNPSLLLYDRYVADGRSCGPTTLPRPVTVPAADGPCTVSQCKRVSGSNR
jgi:hypothetical protein